LKRFNKIIIIFRTPGQSLSVRPTGFVLVGEKNNNFVAIKIIIIIIIIIIIMYYYYF